MTFSCKNDMDYEYGQNHLSSRPSGHSKMIKWCVHILEKGARGAERSVEVGQIFSRSSGTQNDLNRIRNDEIKTVRVDPLEFLKILFNINFCSF